jgi:hypothetical protein
MLSQWGGLQRADPERAAVMWLPEAQFAPILRRFVRRQRFGAAEFSALGGTNFAFQIQMATPGEQAASQTVDVSEPAKATAAGLTAMPLDGVLKHLLEEHGGVFALIKRLGMRSDEQLGPEVEPHARVELLSRELGEMAALYAALSEIVQAELSAHGEADPSELANAVAALGAINPGSPEWGPAFLHMSELVEAHVTEDEQDFSVAESGRPPLLAAS